MKIPYLSLLVLAAAPSVGHAQSLTIQGRVLDGANNPVTGAATEFRVQILSPDAQRCVLFDETHVKDLSGSGGLFSINLNDSTGTPNAPNTYSLDQALSNRAGFVVNASYCGGGGSGALTYTPGQNDNRKVVIQFRDPVAMGSSWETIPEMDLNPTAWAMESRTVGGFPSTSLLRVVGGGVPGSAPALTPADVSELQALTAGTSTRYLARDLAGGARMPSYSGNPSAPAAGSVWFDSTAGALKFSDGVNPPHTLGTGSGGAPGGTAGGDLNGSYPNPTVDGLRGVSVASGAPALGQVLKYISSNWTPSTLELSDLKASDGATSAVNGAA